MSQECCGERAMIVKFLCIYPVKLESAVLLDYRRPLLNFLYTVLVAKPPRSAYFFCLMCSRSSIDISCALNRPSITIRISAKLYFGSITNKRMRLFAQLIAQKVPLIEL